MDTPYLQIVLGFTPLQTGMAVLPLCLGIMISAMLSTAVLMTKLGAKVLVPAGMLVSAIGTVLLMLAKADSGYAPNVAVPMFIIAIGLGAIMSSALSVGTLGVDRHHAGAASAAVHASQQLGGSIRLAVLNTLVAGATITAVDAGEGQLESLVSGYQGAYLACAILLVVGAIVTALMYRSREHTAINNGEAAVHM